MSGHDAKKDVPSAMYRLREVACDECSQRFRQCTLSQTTCPACLIKPQRRLTLSSKTDKDASRVKPPRKPIRFCAEPGCGQPFAPNNNRQRFCVTHSAKLQRKARQAGVASETGRQENSKVEALCGEKLAIATKGLRGDVPFAPKTVVKEAGTTMLFGSGDELLRTLGAVRIGVLIGSAVVVFEPGRADMYGDWREHAQQAG